MGIPGLLPFLSPVQLPTHLRNYSGKTVGVDGYVWLHRGAWASAADIVMGKKNTKYVEFAMSRVRLLQHNGITPLIVFDGGPLPAKMPTEIRRKAQREEALAQAASLVASNKHAQARELYAKALDISPEIAYQFIKALRAANVQYIVAPYEADAQLAYLSQTGMVDAVLTEDSDLLVFGVKEALFKLDASGTVVSLKPSSFGDPQLNMPGWDMTRFRTMSMLAGCDYLPSLPGIGIKTAHKLMRKWNGWVKVLATLRLEGKHGSVSTLRDYEARFARAERAFLYQRVYCPSARRLVHLTPPPPGEDGQEEDDEYIGGDLEPEIARGVAEGDLCPVSYQRIRDIVPEFKPGSGSKTGKASASASTSSKATPRTAPAGQRTLDIFVRPPGGAKKEKEVLKERDTNTPAPPVRKAAASVSSAPSVPSTRQVHVDPRRSGKRTLVDAFEDDRSRRRSTVSSTVSTPRSGPGTTSAFFAATLSQPTLLSAPPSTTGGSVRARHSTGSLPSSQPSRTSRSSVIVLDHSDEEEYETPRRPVKRARVHKEQLPPKLEMVLDPVEQEAGYHSPGSVRVSDDDDGHDEVSSPVVPMVRAGRVELDGDGDMLSSPMDSRVGRVVSAPRFDLGLVPARAGHVKEQLEDAEQAEEVGTSVDLEELYWVAEDDDGDDGLEPPTLDEDSTQYSIKATPEVEDEDATLLLSSPDPSSHRTQQVAAGWRSRFALGSSTQTPTQTRSERQREVERVPPQRRAPIRHPFTPPQPQLQPARRQEEVLVADSSEADFDFGGGEEIDDDDAEEGDEKDELQVGVDLSGGGGVGFGAMAFARFRLRT